MAMLIFAPLTAQAALNLGVGTDSLTETAGQTAGYGETDRTTFAQTIGQVVAIACSFLGIIFTVLLVYAGFYWMLARGEEEKVKKAIAIIRASIIGLIIVLAAYSISYYVTNAIFTVSAPPTQP